MEVFNSTQLRNYLEIREFSPQPRYCCTVKVTFKIFNYLKSLNDMKNVNYAILARILAYLQELQPSFKH